MKRTDSDEAATDGGFTFETEESNVEVTRGERVRSFLEEYVYKSALVAWDDWRTRIGGGLILVYVLIATVGVWVYPYPKAVNRSCLNPQLRGSMPNTPDSMFCDTQLRGLQPFENMNHPLGTTSTTGRDVLGMAIHATPNMLLMVLAGAVWATGIAVIIGTVAGYKGGTVDRVVTTFSDIMMAIPGLPLVIVIAFIYQPSNPLIIGPIIVINYWAGLGRSIRSQVLTLREEPYVEASRTMGVSTPRILTKDIIPNLMPFILVNFAFAARYTVFASVGLYFIGALPYASPATNWGIQLDNAYGSGGALTAGILSPETYSLYVPMVFIALLGLGLVLLAQGLDRVFNPRVRTRLAGESESTGEEDEEGGAMAKIGGA